MNKEFIKYEQALALKELEFDEPCFALFNRSDKPVIAGNTPVFNSKTEDDLIICVPTYSGAFRWFREKYQLFTLMGVRSISPFNIFWSITDGHGNELQGCIVYFKTYEEAESACLDKLIEIIKNDS